MVVSWPELTELEPEDEEPPELELEPLELEPEDEPLLLEESPFDDELSPDELPS